LAYNLLFRWFVGLGIDDPVWDVTVFTKNRDRLLGGDFASKFLGRRTARASRRLQSATERDPGVRPYGIRTS
jgi:transposase